jgi:hypothetical protein
VDIIHECDTVQLKLEAYPFTRYGVVPAVLESISRDAIEDKEKGLVYAARTRPLQDYIIIGSRLAALAPHPRIRPRTLAVPLLCLQNCKSSLNSQGGTGVRVDFSFPLEPPPLTPHLNPRSLTAPENFAIASPAHARAATRRHMQPHARSCIFPCKTIISTHQSLTGQKADLFSTFPYFLAPRQNAPFHTPCCTYGTSPNSSRLRRSSLPRPRRWKAKRC